MAETIRIALAGNPNCGKTTLFNELTGSNGYVGNWPGVTVEKKMAGWRKDGGVLFIDLPGTYSLSPYSPEEVVSRDCLLSGEPDAAIALIDVTNLERSLYLTTQIIETGLPVVVGLNMCDLLKARGDEVDAGVLSKRLGVPVVEISALHATNIDDLVGIAVDAARAHKGQEGAVRFGDDVEAALAEISSAIASDTEPEQRRWYAIKVFERDATAIAPLGLSKEAAARCEAAIAAVEQERDDDAESIITADRYEWIAETMDACVKKAPAKMTASERIDRILTNRWLGIPIFIAVISLVYYISIGTVGTAATDWVNDQLFGDGFFVSSAGSAEYEAAKEAWTDEHYSDQISGYLAAAEKAGVSVEGVQEAIDSKERTPEEEATISRFEEEAKAAGVVARDVPVTDENGNYTTTDGDVVTKLDDEGRPVVPAGAELEAVDEVTPRGFAAAVEGLGEEPEASEYPGYVPAIPSAVEEALKGAGASDPVISLVVDGVIGGVGSVLGFIPQMFVLFVLLSFLEDCGYMSRVAFVMDRVFRRFGLSGKSFIPMLVSSGCGVPGVLATRTIENENDRRMTAMLTTMVPCSAKTPIVALVMGVLAGGSSMWWVAPMFYFMGLAAIIVSAIMLKKTKPFAGEPAPFLMELPDYHFPSIRSWWLHVWERVSAYIRKAGTIIFAAAVGIWALSRFGFATWDGGTGAFGFLQAMEGSGENYMDYSLLAAVGNALSFLFAPLGFGNWQATASTISALIAKENLVGTFGALYGLGDATEKSVTMWNGFSAMFTDGAGVMHVGAMCAFVAFNMLNAPCFAAMGAIRSQMNSPRWFWFAIGYECGFAWVVALIINQLWEFAALGHFGPWTVVALVFLALILFQLLRPMPKRKGPESRILSSLETDAA